MSLKAKQSYYSKIVRLNSWWKFRSDLENKRDDRSQVTGKYQSRTADHEIAVLGAR